jgi:hypothetical protein
VRARALADFLVVFRAAVERFLVVLISRNFDAELS